VALTVAVTVAATVADASAMAPESMVGASEPVYWNAERPRAWLLYDSSGYPDKQSRS
jgi:membrane-bound ClpP family serine protease